jgi:predicted phage terminase large subunit-like protein
MGSVGFNCQYQQQPSDESGGMFRREWWRWWKPDGTAGGGRVEGARIDPACALPATFDRVVIAIDTNQKKAETSDFTAMVVIGVVKARRYVLELVHGQLDYVGLRLWVVKLATKYRGATVLVEEASNGYAILAELGGRVPNLIAVKPLGGKEARAAAMSPGVEAGDWYLPEGVGWVETLVAEHAGFPGAEHDDIVDAAAHAANYLIESGDYETMLAAFGGGGRR